MDIKDFKAGAIRNDKGYKYFLPEKINQSYVWTDENINKNMNEQQEIEFKSQWSDTVLKTACAFANTNGGRIYRCMDDNVNPIEFKEAEEERNQADEKLKTILKEMGVWKK